MPNISFAEVEPASAAATEILREYYAEIVGRYHARLASSQEIDVALDNEPSGDLAGETGALLLVEKEGVVVGCGGVRFVDRTISELTRVFVRRGERGSGIGESIVEQLEQRARVEGHDLMRLDTRSDLTEARRLYSRLGYTEVIAFNSDRHAQHWLAKRL